MHTAVIAAINILVIRNSRLGRSRMVIRFETPSRLCVRDGSRQESDNGRVPQEDDRGLGRNADGYDGFHVGSAAWPAAPHQQNALAGREFAKLDVGVPVLVEALRKRRGLNSISRMSRLAPAAISSLSSPLPMLLFPSKPASCLRYVATAVYTRIQARACRIAALRAAGSSFRRSVGLPGRDARVPRRQADSAD